MKFKDSNKRRKAMALVIVLGALVLITLLCVAFFASTSRELSASKSYASGVSARFYADAAVNVVLGQLGAATTVDDATKVWTSQPGLLRQFDSQGNQTQIFKLYSSDKMIETGTFTLATGGVPNDVPVWTAATPTDSLPWNADPGVYTDLNTPVTVNKRPNYPILNPGGLNAATRIQGFDVASNYGLPDSADLDGDGDTSEIAQIPMPVRWLYVLKDGSLATATRASDKTVSLKLAGGGAVPDTNPPVARIAFWTDDDTSRLNINTASEGNYWTLPVAPAADDSLSIAQINAREFQRYPGHPATTSLSPALEFLTSSTNDLRNFIFALTPRISGCGSQFGTRRIGAAMPVQLDNDRLYASVDDLLFLPNFNAGTGERYRATTANIKALKDKELDYAFSDSSMTATGTAGTPYSFASSFSLDPARLELLRFFLTVDSNAPEVNLFGKPRVSLWPVDTRADNQSTLDKLLAFSSSVNGYKYYFQRKNPESQTDDYDSISRNQDLYSYLGRLTSAAIPGVGGSFEAKYPSDRDQLLTSIFDWIRTVNIAYRDPAGATLPYSWQPNPDYDGLSSPSAKPGSGQVLPIKIGTTSGFGRFPILSKGAMAFVREDEAEIGTSGTNKIFRVKFRAIFLMETYVPSLGYAAIVPDYEIAVSGLANSFAAVTQKGSGTSVVTGTTPLTFQEGAIRVNVPANVQPFSGRAWGGTQGFNTLLMYSAPGGYKLSPRTLGLVDATRGYPYVSDQFQVDALESEKDQIKIGLSMTGTSPVQTVNVTFRNGDGSKTVANYALPFPPFNPAAGPRYGNKTVGAGDSGLRPVLQERVDQMAGAWDVTESDTPSLSNTKNDQNWINSRSAIGLIDMVRGLELGHGDLRLLALHGTNAKNAFIPHKDYDSTSRAQAHSLLGSGGSTQFFYDEGQTYKTRGFLAGTPEQYNGGTQTLYFPQAPSRFSPKPESKYLAVPSPSDFSTGIGSEGDGPHVIKADEGNSSFTGMNWGLSAHQPYQNQLFPWDNALSDAFSPNRQVASAVQLGTLPAKGASDIEWRTLLFRPDIAINTHPGADSPADSALLDLFWMPVVDPYPISQPLSTAGKVNMNSQIAPFTYVERTTALLGALKSVKVMALPNQKDHPYKWAQYTPNAAKSFWPMSYLYDVDATKTMLFFNERFMSSNPDENAFRSPSEICSIPLVPKQNVRSVVGTGHADNPPDHPIATANIGTATNAGSLRAAIKDFWSNNVLTGDNVFEAPYNHLYPRLTTQSNTFTVYVRAQSLQVLPGTPLSNLPENRIKVSGEYRGSFAVERYIDPSNPQIPDFASASNFSKTLYPFYKFRVKGSRQFLPQ
jgi:uncharacterized protein (TIGR02600 family)